MPYRKLSLNNIYGNFSGRVGVKGFWLYYYLPSIFIGITIGFLALVLSEVIMGIIYTLTLVSMQLPFVAILVKRFHDRNKSGWWALVSFIPYFGHIWILIECGCLKGTDYFNDYGSLPINNLHS